MKKYHKESPDYNKKLTCVYNCGVNHFNTGPKVQLKYYNKINYMADPL